ncbi:hypothetical protein PP175_26840 (plasmid) [Aneurinibacillus sp. Ricciae_BoGa-3]|uniref:hypothetical protein n=1 Tax=Aneurinibacillus sp. Ricciae_BoGa-3 TaxID=3022697 RepID=UPI00233F88A9|nr:hypothetical protein [Aneurinibacillus sp. Ricciae_BoGa-3]WCK57655.1 hypothetical protein PP175_26840 [Aneurinibacillus sp. Ricciae_BoGa-3]
MNSNQFTERMKMIYRYFNNQHKWKRNEEGELNYYKGKKNLKELKFIVNVIFDEEFEVMKESFFLNNEDSIIGGTLIGKIYVDADFNGMNQGTGGSWLFVQFTLCETAYFTNQSQTFERLEETI